MKRDSMSAEARARNSPEARSDRVLSQIDRGTEAFALLARDRPMSIYRLFLRRYDPIEGSSCWWRFDDGVGNITYDPIKHHKELDVYLRTLAMWGHVGDLVLFSYHPDKPGLVRAFARIREVCA